MQGVCEAEGRSGEEEPHMGMIAQRRVSENLCTTELAHLSQGDSLYHGLTMHFCLWCLLPTGSENADSTSQSRRQNVS